MNADKAKSIFLEAVEHHEPDQWPAFLDAACANNAELRERVESLLVGHQADVDLLERGKAAWNAVATGAYPAGEPDDLTGSQIGHYKLREKIAEGGMGVVFVAEQEVPVRRKVALKIIKPGMDTKQVIARFEAERQALALMDHPNIAKVLDCEPQNLAPLVRGELDWIVMKTLEKDR